MTAGNSTPLTDGAAAVLHGNGHRQRVGQVEPDRPQPEGRLIMTRALNRMIARFSVRTRIILLALIPVVGFLANGVVFVIGENEVESAFKANSNASTATTEP